jgi:hypothetical protein
MCTVHPFLNLFRMASGTRKPAPAATAPGIRGGRLLGDWGGGADVVGCCGRTCACCVNCGRGGDMPQGGPSHIGSGSVGVRLIFVDKG